MMKVAMIGQKGIPSRSGGIEVHVEEIAKRLVQRGCEVDVYCRESYCQKKGKTFQGITTIFTPCINSKRLDTITHSFLSLMHALFKGNDIIHFHALGPSTLAFIPKLLGKKVVCTVHGQDWKRSKWGRLSKLYLKFGEYATAHFSDRTISVSESLLDYYQKKYGKDIDYIRNGVEIRDRVPPALISEKWGLKENGYFLYLGRLVPEKGIHYLIEAYEHLKTDKKLVIAGGSSHSDAYEKELRTMARNNQDILFTGFVQGQPYEELMSSAFAYILPSDIEGMPLSLLEAMSYGRICLVSDIEENKAVISDYGYTFQAGNALDLTEKMQDLLQDEKRTNIKSEDIIQYVRINFDWDKASEETYELYGKCLAKDVPKRKKQAGDLFWSKPSPK